MSVAARNPDGRWCTVMDLGEPPAAAIRELLVDDVAPVFELDEPALVLAVTPVLPGEPDGLCVTARGELIAVVSVGDEGHEQIRARLSQIASAFEGLSLLELMSRCDRLGLQHTPGSWIATQLGIGDAVTIDHAIEEHLDAGAVTLLVATRCGFEDAALAIAHVRATSRANVRCFDMSFLTAGSIRMLEAYEVSEAEFRSAVKAAERSANAAMMLEASSQELGAPATSLVDTMLHYCDAFFTEVTFRSVGGLVVMESWLDHLDRRQLVLELDSAGTLVVQLSALDPVDRRFFAQALDGMVDEQLWPPGEEVPASLQLSLGTHLTDVSLVELFVGALSDAFLSTMCNDLAPLELGMMRAA